MSSFIKGTNILNHAKDFYYDEYSIENQIEKFKYMTLLELTALKRENEQLGKDMELSYNTYKTQRQQSVFKDFEETILIPLYCEGMDNYELENYRLNYPLKYDKLNRNLTVNRTFMNDMFKAQNRYKSDPTYDKYYAQYNDALTLAIKNLSDESKDKAKFNKKIYDNTEVLCECGAHSYRKALARHRKSDLHARKMEKLNPLLKKVEQN